MGVAMKDSAKREAVGGGQEGCWDMRGISPQENCP
jgi:hypothetical protein